MGPRRPRFYLGVLVAGFLLGGFLSAMLEAFLLESPAKTFFTFSLTPHVGPVLVDLLVVSLTLGFALKVSLLSLIGVVVAYYAARSLF